MTCDLCKPSPFEILWQDNFCRVALLNDADYPTYCRVELVDHVKEMTDLTPENRIRMMNVVFAVEAAMIEVIKPDKINLASLGNKTPHLHWHIVPRFSDDKHFPNSHWGKVVRHDAKSDALQAYNHAPSRAVLLMFKQKVIANINCALANDS